MRTAPPALLPLLRSQVQGDLLALLYLHPERSYSLTEAAQRIDVTVKSVQQEATRLVEAGFLADERRGPLRLIRARTDTPIARPLTDLLAVTYGPLPVLTDLLGAIDGIARAFIYGSWAARYRGEPGPVPADVDVLVIGTADVDELHAAAVTAEERLGRPVDIRRVRPPVWAAGEDAFLAAVRERPQVELDLGGEAP
jgi:predicted nucleotidyltransferase